MRLGGKNLSSKKKYAYLRILQRMLQQINVYVMRYLLHRILNLWTVILWGSDIMGADNNIFKPLRKRVHVW